MKAVVHAVGVVELLSLEGLGMRMILAEMQNKDLSLSAE